MRCLVILVSVSIPQNEGLAALVSFVESICEVRSLPVGATFADMKNKARLCRTKCRMTIVTLNLGDKPSIHNFLRLSNKIVPYVSFSFVPDLSQSVHTRRFTSC